MIKYVSADGPPYFLTELKEALKAYEIRKEYGDILVHKKQCETTHNKLQDEDMKLSLAQIEFSCAYITHMMRPYLKVDELYKLHHKRGETTRKEIQQGAYSQPRQQPDEQAFQALPALRKHQS